MPIPKKIGMKISHLVVCASSYMGARCLKTVNPIEEPLKYSEIYRKYQKSDINLGCAVEMYCIGFGGLIIIFNSLVLCNALQARSRHELSPCEPRPAHCQSRPPNMTTPDEHV
jgi:hypothetical protein